MTLDDLHKNTEADGYRPDLDHQFAPIPGGTSLDFGVIDNDALLGTGLLALPLRISHGEHRGATNGYGLRHILLGHGEELAAENWISVQDFVMSVIDEFDAICKDEASNRWHLVRRATSTIEKHWILIIEAEPKADCYRIVTGWTRDGKRRLKNTPIWERRDRSPEPGLPSPR